MTDLTRRTETVHFIARSDRGDFPFKPQPIHKGMTAAAIVGRMKANARLATFEADHLGNTSGMVPCTIRSRYYDEGWVNMTSAALLTPAQYARRHEMTRDEVEEILINAKD